MAEKFAKVISEKDNVATCVADVKAGENVKVHFNGEYAEYTALEDIPFGHKIAIKPVKKGEKVFKYGVEIGEMSEDVSVGGWIHCHNCIDDYVVK